MRHPMSPTLLAAPLPLQAVTEAAGQVAAAAQDDGAPVVVVGAGPVGMRVARELLRRAPTRAVVVYGDEPSLPYNRVRLSSLLAGDVGWSGVVDEPPAGAGAALELRLGCAVVAIDRQAGTVTDAGGQVQRYSHLVLATGSRPVVPQVRGITLPGVFSFRDVRDAERLIARRVRSRHTVVVGGGLLGLEAARAMRRSGTRVTVLEHSPRLMSRQLDDEGAALLRAEVEARGIEVVTSDALKVVQGDTRLQAVLLRSGRLVECDTLVVAAGIVPNVGLAVDAGLAIGRGIRVDDSLRTSDPRIHAVGECAEHRGRVYGLVAPGFEQAAVAAHVICGGDARYVGSVAAARLKVVGTPVFSMGPIGDDMPEQARSHACRADGCYRSLVLQRGRLVGATAVGDWDELSRVQEAVLAQRRIWPWQRLRWQRSGRLWPQTQASDIVSWPAAAVVCNCTGVSCGQLRAAMRDGATTLTALCAATGASSVCGSCRPQLQALVGAEATVEPARGARWLWGTGLGAALGALGMLLLPGLGYADTSDLAWRWDAIWRDDLYKQISGYLMGALMLVLATLSVRKRVSVVRLGRYDGWRVVHVSLGALALVALLVHSGARLGDNLNLALSLCALGAAATGAVAGSAVAREHLWPLPARRWRRIAGWAHLLCLWPLPVLLVLHVLKFYFFGGGA